MTLNKVKKIYNYSKLLISLEVDLNKLLEVSKLIDQNLAFYKSPKISLEDKVSSNEFSSLIELFIKNGDINLLLDSTISAILLEEKARGIKRYKITAADEATFTVVKEELFVGKMVEKKIDSSILGGFIIEWDNKVIDNSIAQRFKKIIE